MRVWESFLEADPDLRSRTVPHPGSSSTVPPELNQASPEPAVVVYFLMDFIGRMNLKGLLIPLKPRPPAASLPWKCRHTNQTLSFLEEI